MASMRRSAWSRVIIGSPRSSLGEHAAVLYHSLPLPRESVCCTPPHACVTIGGIYSLASVDSGALVRDLREAHYDRILTPKPAGCGRRRRRHGGRGGNRRPR